MNGTNWIQQNGRLTFHQSHCSNLPHHFLPPPIYQTPFHNTLLHLPFHNTRTSTHAHKTHITTITGTGETYNLTSNYFRRPRATDLSTLPICRGKPTLTITWCAISMAKASISLLPPSSAMMVASGLRAPTSLRFSFYQLSTPFYLLFFFYLYFFILPRINQLRTIMILFLSIADTAMWFSNDRIFLLLLFLFSTMRFD